MNISNLFSDEKVNTGRQVELDIAKGLAIVFMIFLHTVMMVQCYNDGLSSTYSFVIGNVLGRPFAAGLYVLYGSRCGIFKAQPMGLNDKKGYNSVPFRYAGKRV